MSLREDEFETGAGAPARGPAGAEGQARAGRGPVPAMGAADTGSGIFVSRSARGMQPLEGATVRSTSIGTGPRLGPARGRTDWRAFALALPGARPLARGAQVAPPLCVAGATAPTGDDWLHEIKWDGFRLLAEVSEGRARLRLRDGQDWTSRFPELVRALEAIGAREAWLDGELVALDRRGLSDYDALKRALRTGRTAQLRYIAFDLATLAGIDLAGVPLIERKRLLERLLAAQSSAMLVYGKHLVGHGERVFAASQRQGAEGIVSKRLAAGYVAGRSGDWVKLRHEPGREFVVVGYTRPTGSRRAGAGPAEVDSLLVARPEGAGLRYCGRVGIGADAGIARELSARLTALASATPPAAIAGLPARASWVRPRLVVELSSCQQTRNGLLRQARLLRVRDDKSADELDPDVAMPSSTSP